MGSNTGSRLQTERDVVGMSCRSGTLRSTQSDGDRHQEAYAELGRWRASPQVSNVRVRVSHNALGPGRWGPAANLLRMRIGTRWSDRRGILWLCLQMVAQ